MMMNDTTAATTSFAWPAMERAMKRVMKNHVDANVKSFLRVVAEEYQLEEEPLARSWEAFATSAAAGARNSQRVVTAATTGVKKKRGMTAYNLFCKMERPAVLEKYPGTTSKEVMKRLGDEWKMLTDADKEAWKQRRLALDAEEESSTQSVPHVANASASETAPPLPAPTSPKSPPRPSVLFTDTAVAATGEEEDDYLQSFQTKLQQKTEEQLRKLCRRYDLPSGSKEAMIRVMMARMRGCSP